MGKLVTPTTHLIGYTTIDLDGLRGYLQESGNMDFYATLLEALTNGVNPGEAICSFYAKLCYASLTLDKNKNVTRIRDIPDNIKSILDSAHGSVLEHCYLNFVAHNCSRVFTHEMVRHRVGTAFSQTSGRYVRGDEVDIVFDPILDPIREEAIEFQKLIEERYNRMVQKMGLDEMKDFDKKKKATSALRRFLPNGQSNEIGFSVNLRALRHIVQVRTSRHAEWEIRLVFGQVYRIVKEKYQHIFADARERMADGALEVYGMRMAPYDAAHPE